MAKYKSFHFALGSVLQHSPKLLVLYFAIARIIHRFDKFFHVDWQLKLFIYDLNQDFSINVATFVCRPSNRSVSIESILVIVWVSLCLLSLLVNFENGLKLDIPFVLLIEL